MPALYGAWSSKDKVYVMFKHDLSWNPNFLGTTLRAVQNPSWERLPLRIQPRLWEFNPYCVLKHCASYGCLGIHMLVFPSVFHSLVWYTKKYFFFYPVIFMLEKKNHLWILLGFLKPRDRSRKECYCLYSSLTLRLPLQELLLRKGVSPVKGWYLGIVSPSYLWEHIYQKKAVADI